MLVLTRKHQEKIRIGDDIVVTVLRTKGKTVRLGIEAPDSVPVLRGELVFEDAEGEEGPAESPPAGQPPISPSTSRGDLPQGSRMPATGWTADGKPQDQASRVPGGKAQLAVSHERVPRRRLREMMPRIVTEAGQSPDRRGSVT